MKVRATDFWVFDFADLTAAATVINGKAESVGGTPITRVVPLRYVDYPDYLLATDFDVEYLGWDGAATPLDGTGAPAAGGYFSHVRFRVEYETPDYTLDGTRAYQALSIRGSERTMRAVSTALRTSGGDSPAHSPDVLVPGADYTITLRRVAGDASGPYGVQPYIDAQGSVNDTLYRGMQPGCLLYRTIEAPQPEVLDGGLVAWDVSLLLSASARPWNHEFLSTGDIDEVLLNGATRRYPFLSFIDYFG